ncbi:MAG: secretin N-terminal domain-containing protein, partial [Kiloniellaceae bacterium]
MSRFAAWGLACALMGALGACQSLPRDAPGSATSGAAAAQPAAGEGPTGEAAAGSLSGPEGPGEGGPLGELSQLPDPGASGLSQAEIYRGTGILARPLPGRVAEVEISGTGNVTLNFANAEIREVVDAVLGLTLGLSYIIDPKVQGQVTARTSRPIPRSAVIPALENILALHGAALTLVDGIYKVVTLKAAAAGLTTPVVAPGRGRMIRGFGIHVIPLKFASAGALLEVLKPFVGPGRVLRAEPARNLLIFAGNGPEARDLMEMVAIFDVDWMAGMSFALFPLQVADAKDLVADLETVFLAGGDSPLAGVVRFVPIARLNAVLAISPQAGYLDRAETWIERLDRGAEGAGRRIFVYYVQNGRAADVANVLSQIFELERPARREAPEAALAPGLTPVSIGAPEQPTARPAQRPADQDEDTAEDQEAGAVQQAQAPVRPSRPQPARARRAAQAAIATVEEIGKIRIIADEVNNALVILATAAEYRMIEATLKRLDIVPLQVLIEATIAEVTLTDELRYGLQWFFRSGESEATFALSNLLDITEPPFPGFSYFLSGRDARVVLNALTKITDVNVVSSP